LKRRVSGEVAELGKELGFDQNSMGHIGWYLASSRFVTDMAMGF
jgi:hypothetical protein